MVILGNPIYLLLAVLLIGGYFVITSLGMEGPTLQVLIAAKDLALKKLKDYVSANLEENRNTREEIKKKND